MKYLVFFFLFVIIQHGNSQKALIQEIKISGNKKTKNNILLRELTFEVGDSLDIKKLSEIFNKNSRYLIGLFLVSKCDFTTNIKDKDIFIKMDVVDAWYIYPIPIFELADRNFNVWWNNYNHNISRVNYGLQLKHYNLTGRKDQLKVTGQNGYTQKLEIDYKIPGVNSKKTMGFFFNLYFKRSKETPFNTSNNKLQFIKENQYFNKSYRARIGLIIRPKLKATHSFSLIFRQNNISETIQKDYNPDFFGNIGKEQRFVSSKYKFSYDTRDFAPYPKDGFRYSFIIEKNGMNIFKDVNIWNLENNIRFYYPLTPKFNFSTFAKLKLRFSKQKFPYNQIKALGYRENQLHGYEYYVIDGERYGFIKTSFRYKIIDNNLNWKKLMPIKSFKIMPIEVYGTFNNDIGYVHTKDYKKLGTYDNRLIWGGGLGIDIIFYTTFVVRIDYSINQFQEKGIFLHFNPIF